MVNKGVPNQTQGSFSYIISLVLLLFGLAYVFILPPFEAPDEPAHFARAYGIAEGQFILKDHPRTLILFIKEALEERRAKDAKPVIMEMQRLLDQYDERIPNVAFNTALYSPIPYMFHSAAIKLVTLFTRSDGSLLLSLYICRVISLLLFVLLLLLSFRFFPSASWPVFWVAVTPMALSQASIVNIDYIVFCSSIILLTISLGDIRDNTYSLCLILSAIGLLLSKPPYLPLLLIPVVSSFCFEGERKLQRRLSVFLAMIIAIGGAVFWSYLVKSLGIYDTSVEFIKRFGQIELNPFYQLTLIIELPAQFCSVILRTLSVHGVSLYHQFVGVLGMLDVPIPFWVAVVWGGSAVVAILIADTPQNMRYRHAVLLGLACVFAAVSASLALFIAAFVVWTPIGATIVNLQGRYFHPIVAIFLVGIVLIKPFDIAYRYKRLGMWCLLSIAVVVNAVSLFGIIQKYW